MKYQPSPIKGDGWHNERFEIHHQYFLCGLAAQGDEKAAEAVDGLIKREYVSQTIDKLGKKLEEDKDLSDKTRKTVLNALYLNYFRQDIRLSQEEIIKHINDATKKLSDELEKMFKDDAGKAKYARTNIVAVAKNKMRQGEEEFDKAAQMVYEIDR